MSESAAPAQSEAAPAENPPQDEAAPTQSEASEAQPKTPPREGLSSVASPGILAIVDALSPNSKQEVEDGAANVAAMLERESMVKDLRTLKKKMAEKKKIKEKKERSAQGGGGSKLTMGWGDQAWF